MHLWRGQKGPLYGVRGTGFILYQLCHWNSFGLSVVMSEMPCVTQLPCGLELAASPDRGRWCVAHRRSSWDSGRNAEYQPHQGSAEVGCGQMKPRAQGQGQVKASPG